MKTKVMYRTWKQGFAQGTVIALFPELAADASPGHCLSYSGQHGSADFAYILSRTRPSTPEEKRKIAAALEKFGYRLTEVKRESFAMRMARAEDAKRCEVF